MKLVYMRSYNPYRHLTQAAQLSRENERYVWGQLTPQQKRLMVHGHDVRIGAAVVWFHRKGEK